MSQALLESVRIPCRQSNTKEWYNVSVVEKLLQILFSACQYGKCVCWCAGYSAWLVKCLPNILETVEVE